jgi:predicted molibdopterin-dependent oxidoreductase YjgC
VSPSIEVDGELVPVARGAMLTAALIAAGRWVLRSHPVTGTPRGPLCGMGVCLECDVTVDGRTGTRACLTRVSDGMRIQTGSAGSAT